MTTSTLFLYESQWIPTWGPIGLRRVRKLERAGWEHVGSLAPAPAQSTGASPTTAKAAIAAFAQPGSSSQTCPAPSLSTGAACARRAPPAESSPSLPPGSGSTPPSPNSPPPATPASPQPPCPAE